MTGKKILIVDFDYNSLTSMTSLFGAQNMDVITASDGAAAYDKFKAEKPDLVILEAMLPKMHGFDLTLKISQETKGQVPVIICTGVYKGPQYKNEALRSFGASDYFEKPFDEKKLVNSVLKLLSEDIDIEEELPSPDTVLKTVSQLVEEDSPSTKKKTSKKKSI